MERSDRVGIEKPQVFEEIGFDSGFHVTDEQLEQFAEKVYAGGIDTRKKLSEFVPIVDEYQNLVVKATEKTIRVVAPAGSGKTQTVINRAIEQIKNGINANRILLLTFDNSAVGSIISKFDSLKTELAISFEVPEIRTLNAFGFAILREFVPKEYKSIVEPSFLGKVISEIKKNLREISVERYSALPRNLTNSFYLDYFSFLKNQLFDPRNINKQILADLILANEESYTFFEDPTNKKKVKLVLDAIIWLFQAQEVCFQKYKVMDFDDQKLRAFIAISEEDSLRRTIQNKYSEIIVDEFQDINKLDFEFIKLVSQKATLLVVGDDDQAIYGFRGSSPDYIIYLEKHLGRVVKSYELSMNYRCPRNIVRHADNLIQHNNPNRILKNPIPVADRDAKIKVVPSPSPIDEAKRIVIFIDAVRSSKTKELGQQFGFENFAVLYRANAQSFPLQIEFIKHGVPYHVRNKDNILNNRALEKILAILQVKIDIEHKQGSSVDTSLRVIDAYFRYIAPAESRMLREYFSRSGTFESLINDKEFTRVLPKFEASNFPAVIRELSSAKKLDDALEVISNRFNNMYGLIGSLEDVADDKVPLGEIFDIASSFGGKTEEFVAYMNQIMDTARKGNAGKDEKGGVALRTYFRAKGLQWDTVILTTVNEGLIPHKRADVEDERRLFYVAITRVSANLYISYVKNVSKNTVKPSVFLKEAGFL